ncbi:hypothetical protein GQ55_5G210700 [Panicum hallii var. hallii]|uniref:Uncharacterized protein n=1 Tax=Panicum hallii var. hallii TaxID=1504633 RepID=A0A2T7DIL7_9POAL|nr:hypothetical protein GQ55_5G210700 [Panicum hallii var. hallii]
MSVSLLQKGVFMMSIFRSILPRVARSNGWRCFSTRIPYDNIAELNKVRHLNILFGCCLSLILFLQLPRYLTETRVLDMVSILAHSNIIPDWVL